MKTASRSSSDQVRRGFGGARKPALIRNAAPRRCLSALRVVSVGRIGFEHPGHTGVADKDNVYRLRLTQRAPGARYALRASVAGRGGINSFGLVEWAWVDASRESTPP